MTIKNKITTLILLLSCSLTSMAQVGIGTTTPNANAALDVVSTSQGILLPRMTTAQRDAIASPAKGLTIFNTDLNYIQTNTSTTSTATWKNWASSPSSNGTAVVSAYTCTTASAGILKVGTPVSGVTQTITATVGTVGTYSISTTANGVTFAATGTFAGTGAQNIVLTATGTPTAKGSNTYTLNTTPNCNFSRYASVTGCYARISISPDVFKDFLCHNLGADISLDPNTPVVGLQGAYIQWGRRGPNTTGESRVDWQTAGNTANFAAAPTSVNANEGAVSGWSTSAAANNAWRTSGGAKTAADPCPSGYRVPTSTEWTGVNTNNTVSKTGTWTLGNTEYGSALHYGPNATTKTLSLPATGQRSYSSGTLASRGSDGTYCSSTENGAESLIMYFNNFGVNPVTNINRTLGFSLRCIEVDNPSTNGTAVVSGYTCNTASAGTMTTGIAVSGVTQTITATVTTVGTYGITATANGVTFTATGTFAGTGDQTIVLTATGTPTAKGSNTYTLNTTPNCNFSRYASVTGCYANVGGTIKDFLCYNLGVTGTQDPLTYQSGNNNGTLYQWGRQTDGHELPNSTAQAGPVAAPVASRFITNGSSPYDWRNPQNNTLWGDGTTGANPPKSANDPCPTGFKVPSGDQWSRLFSSSGYPNDAQSTATQNIWTWTGNGFKVGSNLYLPAAGQRSAYNGTIQGLSTNGEYWSSSVFGDNAFDLRFSSTNVAVGLNSRGHGFSVRCISE